MGTQAAYDRRVTSLSGPSAPPTTSGARMPTVHPRHSISRQPSMRPSAARLGRTSAGLLGAVLVLASCAGDQPTGANEPNLSTDVASAGRLSVCHRTGATGTIVEVSPADLA